MKKGVSEYGPFSGSYKPWALRCIPIISLDF